MTSQKTPPPDDQDQVTVSAETRMLTSKQPVQDDFHVTHEQDGTTLEMIISSMLLLTETF